MQKSSKNSHGKGMNRVPPHLTKKPVIFFLGRQTFCPLGKLSRIKSKSVAWIWVILLDHPSLVRSRAAPGFLLFFLVVVLVQGWTSTRAGRRNSLPLGSLFFPARCVLPGELCTASLAGTQRRVVECCSVLWGELPLVGGHRLVDPPKVVRSG